MRNGSFFADSLAPLVLRLTLGVIFLYHGYQKVSGRNEAGASWATRQWERQQSPPDDVVAKLDEMSGMSSAEIDTVKERLKIVYSHKAESLPGTLRYSAAQLAVAWGEILGGLALILGLFTRLAAAGMIVVQLGAIATVTYFKGFSFAHGGGYEYNLALLAMCLSLVLTGAGLLSADACLKPRHKPHAAAP
jgi:uncharacterized membrane protein YphA (DoxX/SURF4 family)